jgi:uncharacterized FlaG/YvyC family protein
MKNRILKKSIRTLSVFITLVVLSGCALTANYGSNSDENKTQTQTFKATFDSVYRSAIQVAAEQNWSIKNSDKDAGYFMAETPGSLKVWSDEVNVTISEKQDQVVVTVKSKLGQKPNREIVTKYLTALKKRLKD